MRFISQMRNGRLLHSMTIICLIFLIGLLYVMSDTWSGRRREAMEGERGQWENQSVEVDNSPVAVATRTAIDLEELKKKIAGIKGLRDEVADLSGIVHDNAKAIPELRDGLNQCQDTGS